MNYRSEPLTEGEAEGLFELLDAASIASVLVEYRVWQGGIDHGSVFFPAALALADDDVATWLAGEYFQANCTVWNMATGEVTHGQWETDTHTDN